MVWVGGAIQPPAVSRDIFTWIRVLRAPSSLAWNGSRNGASPTSLGNLGQGLTTLAYPVLTSVKMHLTFF